MMQTDGHHWRRNCSNGACIEVADTGDSVLIRDSQNPTHVLRVTKADWDSFKAGVKNGLFDHGTEAVTA